MQSLHSRPDTPKAICYFVRTTRATHCLKAMESMIMQTLAGSSICKQLSTDIGRNLELSRATGPMQVQCKYLGLAFANCTHRIVKLHALACISSMLLSRGASHALVTIKRKPSVSDVTFQRLPFNGKVNNQIPHVVERRMNQSNRITLQGTAEPYAE